MSLLMNCAICCFLLSVWGVIQLGLMGVFYSMEATVFIEDTEAHEYDNFEDFMTKTQKNYSIVATNCFIAAVMYIVMIGLSCLCLKKARKDAKRQAEILADDELSCLPPEDRPKQRHEKKAKGKK